MFCLRLVFPVLIAGFTATAAAAQGADPALAPLGRILASEVILPGYQALSASASAFRDNVGEACTGAAETVDRTAMRRAFDRLSDAWMAVQPIRFGAVERHDRWFRIAFWPDRKNQVGRHLNRLRAPGAGERLQPDRFARASVAVQGLPAAERLLFDPHFMPVRDCPVLGAIAGNLQAIADDIAADWERAAWDEAAAAARSAMVLKMIVQQLEFMRRAKLSAPLGGKRVFPKRAEMWRSGRMRRNLQGNLEGLRALFFVGGAGFTGAMVDREAGEGARLTVWGLFDDLARQLEALPEPLSPALRDPAIKARVGVLENTLETLQSVLVLDIGPGLGIRFGFNALDGD